jgi:hypothetical protein
VKTQQALLGTLFAAGVVLLAAEAGWAQAGAKTREPEDQMFGRAGYDGFSLPERSDDGRAVNPQPNVGYGPLRLSSQSPFQSMRLSPGMDAPSNLPRGRWETRETNTWSKMWGMSDRYLLDYEVLRQTQSIVYGVTDDLQAELGVGESTKFGGKLDGLVRGFHDMFGIRQAGRDLYPRGEYHFQLRPKGGATIDIDEDRGGDPSQEFLYLGLHQTLTRGSHLLPAVSVSFTIQSRLESSPDVSGNAIETAFSVTFAKRFGEIYGYVSLGASWLGDQEFHGVELRSTGFSALAALEWNLVADVSLVVQHLYTRGAMSGYGDLSEPSYEISLGVKVEAARGMVVELAVIENIIVFDNSPDFGVHFGFTQKF